MHILEAKGSDGLIILDGNRLEVRKTSLFGKVTGTKTVLLKSVTGVDLENAGSFREGFLQIFCDNHVSKNPKSLKRDEPLAVFFVKASQGDFEAMKDAILSRAGGDEVAQAAPPQEVVPDEIEDAVDEAEQSVSDSRERHEIAEEQEELEKRPSGAKTWYWLGGGLVVFVFIATSISPEYQSKMQAVHDQVDKEKNEKIAVEADEKAAFRQSGFHCLSAWNGSNYDTIEQVKDRLRDPKSFEHINTKIYGNDNGEHGLWMQYRAKNGFGGLNVERIYARIDHETCKATLKPSGPGS